MLKLFSALLGSVAIGLLAPAWAASPNQPITLACRIRRAAWGRRSATWCVRRSARHSGRACWSTTSPARTERGEMFRQLSGAPVVHVPYRGSRPAVVDLLGGQLDFMFVDTAVLPHVASGRLRALAVTGKKRLGAAPDVPTMEEEGVKGFYVDTWYSIVAPAGAPPEATERLNTEVAKMVNSPAIRAKMKDIGVDPAEDTSSRYIDAIVRSDTARWKKLIAGTHIKVD